jgi:FKBP-type peptidyl-prolyl cis-trans isomerase FklB
MRLRNTGTLALSMTLLACQGNTQEKVQLKTQQDSLSYSIGLDIAKNLRHQSVDVNPLVLAQGIKDQLAGAKTLLSEQEAQATLMAFQARMMAKQQEAASALGSENKLAGEKFLAENRKKDKVVTLPSGLQYKVLTMGKGKKPRVDQTVTVNYRGSLIDGKEFDSSYKRGEPATFKANQVIKGWTQALQLMPVGSKWQLFIPSELAYGERGAGQLIGPNATLVFEVELLAIK